MPVGKPVFTSAAAILTSVAGATLADDRARAPGPGAPGAPARAMTVAVDAGDIERGLVHSVITIPARPGPLDLYYVEWTPGNHNPSGPIQNVVNLFVKDSAGARLDWRRDPTHIVRITVDVPAASPSITVELSYIANQPGVNSRSSDTYGKAGFGGINWNTVLVYPGDADKDELLVQPSLTAPPGWRAASALRAERADEFGAADGPHIRYAPVTLAQLVDSPVILAAALSSRRIPAADRPPHFIHSVARKPDATRLPDSRLEAFGAMVGQAERIFGPFPRSQYHFLILLGDDLPGFGLEHCESTYISMEEKEFINAGRDAESDPMTVVPHEYIHAWCGKLRAPEGLLHANYHTPGRTQLMWVYEGLTTYYTDVLAARCGLLTQAEFNHRLAARVNAYQLMDGRRWRSVEDTASALRVLRERSAAWEDLRRRQDYYGEGALFWIECDAIIRAGSSGRKSLDDFCLAFFSVPPGPAGRPSTYTRADIVAALTAVYPGQDWSDLIHRRIESPQDDLAFGLPALLGREFRFVPEPTDLHKKDEKEAKDLNLRSSIGFITSKEGQISGVVPSSPADRARLAHAMKIVGVDGAVFTPERLKDAVAASTKTGKIDLLINVDGERLETRTLEYDRGLRYPALEPLPGAPDLIADIIRPR